MLMILGASCGAEPDGYVAAAPLSSTSTAPIADVAVSLLPAEADVVAAALDVDYRGLTEERCAGWVGGGDDTYMFDGRIGNISRIREVDWLLFPNNEATVEILPDVPTSESEQWEHEQWYANGGTRIRHESLVNGLGLTGEERFPGLASLIAGGVAQVAVAFVWVGEWSQVAAVVVLDEQGTVVVNEVCAQRVHDDLATISPPGPTGVWQTVEAWAAGDEQILTALEQLVWG